MSVEIFLARMLLIVASNPLIDVKNNGDSTSKGITDFGKLDPSCERNFVAHKLEGIKEDKFYYGEALSFRWKESLKLDEQTRLYGRMIMKYEDNKYDEVNVFFTLCEPRGKAANFDAGNAKSELAREIFFSAFIRPNSNKLWDCVEEKTLSRVGDKFFWERDLKDFIHCDANATIRFDLYSTVKADCGIGGSGESFTTNAFRVLFNVLFDNCDGKKYDQFKGLPKGIINQAKLVASKIIIDEVALNPVIL